MSGHYQRRYHIAFGVKAFPIRDILAKMSDAMNKGSSGTKTSAMALVLEITKWIGTAPFATRLGEIKPVQKTKFENLYAARDPNEPKPRPQLYLRKERALALLKEETKESSTVGGGGALKKSVTSDGDAREYVQEVDLVKVLKSTDYVKLLAEEK